MKPVVFNRIARAEFDRATAHYRRQSESISHRLQVEIADALSRIQNDPPAAPHYEGTEFQFQTVHRFPYVIYYRELVDRIWIVAVSHGSRRPGYWRRRQIDD